MSTQRYASPLMLKPRPSRILCLALNGIHLLALVLVLALPAGISLTLLLLLAVAVSYFLGLLRLGWWYSPQIARFWPPYHELIWNDADQWVLGFRDGGRKMATLLPNSFVHPALIVLNLQLTDEPWYLARRWLILGPGSENADVLRRLRVRLRWCGPAPQESDWRALK